MEIGPFASFVSYLRYLPNEAIKRKDPKWPVETYAMKKAFKLLVPENILKLRTLQNNFGDIIKTRRSFIKKVASEGIIPEEGMIDIIQGLERIMVNIDGANWTKISIAPGTSSERGQARINVKAYALLENRKKWRGLN